MYHVARWDVAFEGGLGVYEGHSDAHARRELVGRSVGATHTSLTMCRLGEGGTVDRLVHSFETIAYVLDGTPTVELEGRAFQLLKGDYILFPVGTAHAWRNERDVAALWLEHATPIPEPETSEKNDTFFLAALARHDAVRPEFSSPLHRWIGHYEGTPPQAETLAVKGPPRGRPPAGMDTALLAYSGISVKMMVDAGFGADLSTMFMVDYEPGGAAQIHDHPFEEAYFFTEGEIEGEIEGSPRTFSAGGILFCGVGVDHGFFNVSGRRVRWIETQAPQPPRRHAYRWPSNWAGL